MVKIKHCPICGGFVFRKGTYVIYCSEECSLVGERIVLKRIHRTKEYKIKKKEYRENPENKKKQKEYMKRWYLDNLECVKEYRQRPEIRERERKRCNKLENRKKRILDCKKWHKENREYALKYYYRVSKTKEYKLMKEKYLKRPEIRERINKLSRERSKTPNGQIATMRKRQLRAGNGLALLSPEDIKRINKRDKKCVYCGSLDKLTIDHIIPVSKGGTDRYENLVRACFRCNPSKCDRDVFEWCKEKEREVPKIVIELLNKQKSQMKI